MTLLLGNAEGGMGRSVGGADVVVVAKEVEVAKFRAASQWLSQLLLPEACDFATSNTTRDLLFGKVTPCLFTMVLSAHFL